MKIEDKETKEKLVQRLRRIEGQVRGVQAMLNEERDCREIMQQLAAIHSAVQSTSRIFLQDYASICMASMDESAGPAERQQKQQRMIQDMIMLLDKTP